MGRGFGFNRWHVGGALCFTEHFLPAEDRQAEELPAEELPTEELPAEVLQTEELPTEELPAEDLQTEELPMEDLSAEDRQTEDLPAEELRSAAVARGNSLNAVWFMSAVSCVKWAFLWDRICMNMTRLFIPKPLFASSRNRS